MSINEDGFPKWMVELSDYVDAYVNKKKGVNWNKEDGFGVSPGVDPNTQGIYYGRNCSSFVGRMEKKCVY